MRFSIVIPVYNKADTLLHSIESVLSQEYDDYEIVIVDDGSTDGFPVVAEQLSANRKIKIIRQENAGVSVARNVGIKNAAGEFICFLDADDCYLPNHLKEIDRLIHMYPEQTYFATSHTTLFPDGRKVNSNRLLKNYSNDFVCENLFLVLNQCGDGVIHTNSMCIERASIFKDNVFFEPYEKIGEDTDMWFRLALYQPIVISREVTTVYRREYSTATAKSTNTMKWIFARRLEQIKKMDISLQVKRECSKLVDRYKMTCSRDYLCANNKKAAKQMLGTVEYKTVKYYISIVLCLLPIQVSKWLISRI